MSWKELDWKFKLIFMLVICSIVGVIGGFIAVAIVAQTELSFISGLVFWIGFGIGFITPIGYYLSEQDPPSWVRAKKDPFWRQGNVYEKVEKVEEKDDFKNLDWLKHQYYDLGKIIQNIADDQGVSMMTIRKWIDKIENR